MKKEPIRRNKNILKLSKEHHSGLLFCWKIKQGVKYGIAKERMIKYAQYFWKNYVDAHFTEEETILFTPLKDDWVQRAIEEHQQIKNQLEDLPSITEDNANEQLLLFAKLVDDHIRYEERELFPHLEKELSDEQLDAIGKQLDAAQTAPLEDEYADEFWMKK